MKQPTVFLAITLLLCGCSIVQTVNPITLSSNEPREICLVENPDVHHDFLATYRNALANKNLTVQMLPPGSAVGTCQLTSTYSANWHWDLALYLVYADLKVYRNGRPEGEALYDSRAAGLNTNKFVNAAAKIQELTDQLFPG